MVFEMRFHHRDSLKKPSPAATAKKEDEPAPVYIPLKDVEFHTKDELVKTAKEPKEVYPLPPSKSPFGRANSYLSLSECESLKINKHSTREKDQKLIDQAERRAKIVANILGMGLPFLFSCMFGNKKDKHEDAQPVRPVHQHAHS